jgi:hypothetical protein
MRRLGSRTAGEAGSEARGGELRRAGRGIRASGRRATRGETYHLRPLESDPTQPGRPPGGPGAGLPAGAPVPAPSPVPPRKPVAAGGKGSPGVAALLSWVLPGAGHLYVGQVGAGLLCFVLVQGLYLLGLRLGDGMGFEYLDVELRSLFAPALSPEVGNLGGFLYQMQHYGFGPGFPRPYPEWLRVGSALTAVSGLANLVVIAHAHWLAGTAVRATRWSESAHAALLSTLVLPGLGHWLQGRRRRAVVVCVMLVGLFALGTLLAEGTNLSRERHFYYWSGQFLLGGPAILAEVLFGKARVASEIAYVDAGLVFGCIAGLLNILAMIDVYGWSEWKLLGVPLRASRHQAKGAA